MHVRSKLVFFKHYLFFPSQNAMWAQSYENSWENNFVVSFIYLIYISVICVFCPFKDILVSHVTSCDWFAVVVVVNDVYFQEYDNHTCCSSRSMLYIPHLYERNLSDSWPSGHLFSSMRITEHFSFKGWYRNVHLSGEGAPISLGF